MGLARRRSFLRLNRFDGQGQQLARKIEQFENNVRTKFDQLDQDVSTGTAFALPDGSEGEVLLIRDNIAVFGFAPFQVVETTTSLTAPENAIVRVGAVVSQATITLPSAPHRGAWVMVSVTNAVAFSVIVDGGGHNIYNGFDDAAATTRQTVDGETTLYVYVPGDGQWRIIAKHLPRIPQLISTHTADANTVALWQLDPPATGGNGKLDSSGNGFTLAMGGGSERYAELGLGQQGFLCDGANYMKRNGAANDAALNLVGDMTIECLVRPLIQPAALGAQPYSAVITSYGTPGETGGNDNVLWNANINNSLSTGPVATNIAISGFFWETGAGVDHQINDSTLFPVFEVQHLAWVRSAAGATVTAYVNGFAHSVTAATVGTLGGTPAQFVTIGADHNGANLLTGIVGSVKISNVARSADYIYKDFLRTLGWKERGQL